MNTAQTTNGHRERSELGLRIAGVSGIVTRTVSASELRPGDIIIHRGEAHPIANVERGAGWAWPVASDGAGWAMALGDVVAVMDEAA